MMVIRMIVIRMENISIIITTEYNGSVPFKEQKQM